VTNTSPASMAVAAISASSTQAIGHGVFLDQRHGELSRLSQIMTSLSNVT
jgi:hypothetical protein